MISLVGRKPYRTVPVSGYLGTLQVGTVPMYILYTVCVKDDGATMYCLSTVSLLVKGTYLHIDLNLIGTVCIECVIKGACLYPSQYIWR